MARIPLRETFITGQRHTDGRQQAIYEESGSPYANGVHASAVVDPKNMQCFFEYWKVYGRDPCGLLGDGKGAYPFSTERQELLSRLALEALPYLDLDVEHFLIRNDLYDMTYENNEKVHGDFGWHENVPNRLKAIDLPTFI